MNIALIGYGKMGKAIEEIAIQRGHQVMMRIGTANRHELNPGNLRRADVVIEFTRPDAARQNVLECLDAGIPVVCGTTGWNDGLPAAKMKAVENDTALLWASNFSVGVNIFFEVNKLLASLMNGRQEYEVSMEEIHHTQKKDSPSGTAISLAEQVIDSLDNKKHWIEGPTTNPELLPIHTQRIDPYPGTHSVKYHSAIDDIEIIHTAHNRKGFATGAVLAAEFIAGKKGIFEMKDVLGIR
ncbi:MAG: 4-hydroxy-tetrahydrodipicolinate reductase [Flavipsychrobacter sp.]|nr:4-hydroxy-tetrahydrodipicolinate reductase [Flavipsychrobacter sp.]